MKEKAKVKGFGKIVYYSSLFTFFTLCSLFTTYLFSPSDIHYDFHTPLGDSYITLDSHGIPTISGTSLLATSYATGYIQAKHRLWAMHFLRIFASGRLAEVALHSLSL